MSGGSDPIRRITELAVAGRPSEALAAAEQVLRIAPSHPALIMLKAAMLLELRRNDEAIATIGPVVRAREAPAPAFVIRGHALWRKGLRLEAAQSFAAAVDRNPGDVETRENLGRLLLQLGDYERGWVEYEYRNARLAPFANPSPPWKGEALDGKSLLVVAEQGLGDTLQFARYVPLLTKRGARVTGIVQPALIGVVDTIDSSVRWISDRNNRDRFDFQVDMMSLPRLFGTHLNSVPNDVPYVFAQADRVAHWRTVIGADGYKIGVAWQGSAGIRRDDGRTIPLIFLAGLSAIPGVRLISIQGQTGLDQLARIPPVMRIETLGDRIANNPNGVAEIAGVMANLDLVVTSDTMTAHLAGALGRPVWVALKHDPDWRWLCDRANSPWYPTMRLFRQKRQGDWGSLAAEMTGAVEALVAKRQADEPASGP